MNSFVSGIQQIGIGVKNVDEAWKWYRNAFGMDVPIFNDTAEAPFMTRYTGDTVHSRTAVLAVNLRGGGGFEIWQFRSREPVDAGFTVLPGDLGITSVTLKTTDIDSLFTQHSGMGCAVSDTIATDPSGSRTYFVRDPYGNLFQIMQSDESFAKTNHLCAGVCGVTIGASDVDIAKPLYMKLLGYGSELYDETGTFEDYSGVEGGDAEMRRVKLQLTQTGVGSFGRLFGTTAIELISVKGRKPRKIYEGRYWGDCGFIHACFDVHNTDELKERSVELGLPFTVDSGGSFDMGDAEGRFSYTEDPDGTLIEMVETFRMPILAKLGISLNLTKRNPANPLPNWILKALCLMRVRD